MKIPEYVKGLKNINIFNDKNNNLNFQLSWCETNLIYLNGCINPTEQEIKNKEFMISEIKRIKELLGN